MVEELGVAGGLLFFSNGWRKAHKHCINLNVLDVFFLLFLRYVIETVETKENGGGTFQYETWNRIGCVHMRSSLDP